ANVGPVHGAIRPCRSSWSAAGHPLPFVPYDDTWRQAEEGTVPSYRSLYEQSLSTFANQVAAATIPVETIDGRVVVSSGGDDLVWPSDIFAAQIAQRRATNGRDTTLITSPSAGHRVNLSGEPAHGQSGMRRKHADKLRHSAQQGVAGRHRTAALGRRSRRCAGGVMGLGLCP
ncbi:MAG: hypothetical protein M3Y73_03485, partial [Actinomycetota bacterium]|nr:hypothetical protein [Actinomycetota bacterium]